MYLLPSWTLEHIGIAGEGPGHTSLTQASGSVFDPKTDVMALVKNVVESGDSKKVGVGLELDTKSPVGWISLTDNTTGAVSPTGFVLQEAPAGSTRIRVAVQKRGHVRLSATELLYCADKQMYEAKNSGKNQFKISIH